MAKKLDNEIISNRMAVLYNGEYELKSKYINNASGGTLYHKICGNEFKLKRLTRFFNESSDCPCPKCRDKKSKRYTFDEYKKEVENRYNGIYTVVTFTKANEKSTFKCNLCNINFEATAGDVLLKNRFSGCPRCNKSKRGKHQVVEDYLSNVMERSENSDEYEWLEDYKGYNNIKHKIRHKVCKNEYFVRPRDFLQGYRCPICARKKSNNETELFNCIKNIFSDAIQSDRTQINPLHILLKSY